MAANRPGPKSRGDSRHSAHYKSRRAGIAAVRKASRVLDNDRFGAVWRRLVLAFTLLAFAQASYVTQTHIHIPADAAGGTVLAPAGHGKAPLPDDPAHCPFCQEYLLAGAYLIPPPVVLPLPVSATFQVHRLVRALSFVAAISHSWHGRAPPLI